MTHDGLSVLLPLEITYRSAICPYLKPFPNSIVEYPLARRIRSLMFLQQILPLEKIGHRHTEGLPVGFLPDLFIMRTDVRDCHYLTGVEDRLPKALPRLLTPLDFGYIWEQHKGLTKLSS